MKKLPPNGHLERNEFWSLTNIIMSGEYYYYCTETSIGNYKSHYSIQEMAKLDCNQLHLDFYYKQYEEDYEIKDNKE